MNDKTIITITGPSLSGKTTMERKLMAEGIPRLISTTTRAPRTGEVDGENYYFVPSISAFCGLDVIESTFFDDNFYGVEKTELEGKLKKQDAAILVCDPIGQRQIESYASFNGINVFSIFIETPLHRRMWRFVQRYRNDGMRDAANYMSRLFNMIEVESSWRLDAESYSVIVKDWGNTSETDEEIVAWVIRAIKAGKHSKIKGDEFDEIDQVVGRGLE